MTEETQTTESVNEDSEQVESTEPAQDTAQASEPSANSMLNGLEEGEGLSFDFTSGEKPEGFPDEYWNQDEGSVNVQALFEGHNKQEKIAKDLRAKMGKGTHKAPESSDEYSFTVPEGAEELFPSDDPIISSAKDAAHKFGLSQDQYEGFMGEVASSVLELQKNASDPNSEQNEVAMREHIQSEIKAIGPNGAQVLRAVDSWANELLSEGTLNEQDVETLREEGLTSAKMVQMFNRLRSRMGGGQIPSSSSDDGLPPDSEIADMINKAYESRDEKKIRKAEDMLDKRRQLGRPEKLSF